jgi:hypothetical protein
MGVAGAATTAGFLVVVGFLGCALVWPMANPANIIPNAKVKIAFFIFLSFAFCLQI